MGMEGDIDCSRVSETCVCRGVIHLYCGGQEILSCTTLRLLQKNNLRKKPHTHRMWICLGKNPASASFPFSFRFRIQLPPFHIPSAAEQITNAHCRHPTLPPAVRSLAGTQSPFMRKINHSNELAHQREALLCGFALVCLVLLFAPGYFRPASRRGY